LVEEVAMLIAEPKVLEGMSERARAFARPGAAKRAADVLESLGGSR
jgi:hypothetical protein